MTEIIVTFLATFGVTFFRDVLKHRTVKTIAKAILADPANPTTDPAVALREAWVTAHHGVWSKQVDQLEKQHAAGKLRVASAIAAAKENARGIDATVLPLEGNEVFTPGWPVK